MGGAETATRPAQEPPALAGTGTACIQGIACRFPGIADASALWQAYRVTRPAGQDAVRPLQGDLDVTVPADGEAFWGLPAEEAAAMSPALVSHAAPERAGAPHTRCWACGPPLTAPVRLETPR